MDDICVSIGSEDLILSKNLGMSTKFGPKLLSLEQKQWRLYGAQDMLGNANSDPNFANAHTISQARNMNLYIRSRNQDAVVTVARSVNTENQKIARNIRNNVKIMLTVFFDPTSLVHHENQHKAHPSQRSIIRKYFVSFVLLCRTNDRICR